MIGRAKPPVRYRPLRRPRNHEQPWFRRGTRSTDSIPGVGPWPAIRREARWNRRRPAPARSRSRGSRPTSDGGDPTKWRSASSVLTQSPSMGVRGALEAPCSIRAWTKRRASPVDSPMIVRGLRGGDRSHSRHAVKCLSTLDLSSAVPGGGHAAELQFRTASRSHWKPSRLSSIRSMSQSWTPSDSSIQLCRSVASRTVMDRQGCSRCC